MAMFPMSGDEQIDIASINSISDDVLELILEYLSPPPRSFTEQASYAYQDCSRYLRVCNRWRRIYEPFFYRFPNLGRHGWNNPRRVSGLLATFGSRPDLRNCVRRLEITPISLATAASSEECPIVEIIQACKPTLRSVLLHTDWHCEEAWSLIYALENHRLHSLELLGTANGVGIQSFLNFLDSPTLRVLVMNRYGCLDDELNRSPGLELFNPSEGSESKVLDRLARCVGQGSLTTLRLDERYPRPEITGALLTWPAKLLYLDLAGSPTARDPYSLRYTAAEMESMLEPQRESLESISLGNLKYSKTNNLPNFTTFPRLRRLRMPLQTLCGEDPAVAVERLSAPKLTHFDFVYYLIRPPNGNITRGFVSRNRDWLINFGATLTTSSSAPPSFSPFSGKIEPAGEGHRSLSHMQGRISVQYYPDSVSTIQEHFIYPVRDFFPDLGSWPWQYMEEAAKSLDTLGVKVDLRKSMSLVEWQNEPG